MMEVKQISRKFKDYSDMLPTEYPFKQMLAIYAGRIAILLTGAFLTALLAVFILLVAKAPTYSFLIAILIFLLIGTYELIKPSRPQDTSSLYQKPDTRFLKLSRQGYELAQADQIVDKKSGERKKILDELVQARAEKVQAEINILEYSLRSLSETMHIRNRLFREKLERWSLRGEEKVSLFAEESTPFEIEEEARIARMSFYAAGACILCEALLSGWLSIQLGFHFLYGIIPAALLVTIFQGIVLMLFGRSVRRIKRFILAPSALLFFLSFILFLAGRITGGDVAFNLLPVFSISLWIITTVLPIMAGAFFAIGQEMSWSKKAEEEYKALEKEQLKLRAMRERLISELSSPQILLEAEIQNQPIELLPKTIKL